MSYSISTEARSVTLKRRMLDFMSVNFQPVSNQYREWHLMFLAVDACPYFQRLAGRVPEALLLPKDHRLVDTGPRFYGQM